MQSTLVTRTNYCIKEPNHDWHYSFEFKFYPKLQIFRMSYFTTRALAPQSPPATRMGEPLDWSVICRRLGG